MSVSQVENTKRYLCMTPFNISNKHGKRYRRDSVEMIFKLYTGPKCRIQKIAFVAHINHTNGFWIYAYIHVACLCSLFAWVPCVFRATIREHLCNAIRANRRCFEPKALHCSLVQYSVEILEYHTWSHVEFYSWNVQVNGESKNMAAISTNA